MSHFSERVWWIYDVQWRTVMVRRKSCTRATYFCPPSIHEATAAAVLGLCLVCSAILIIFGRCILIVIFHSIFPAMNGLWRANVPLINYLLNYYWISIGSICEISSSLDEFWGRRFLLLFFVYFLFLVSSLLFLCLVPCGRLSWLLVSFWTHVNIAHRIVS